MAGISQDAVMIISGTVSLIVWMIFYLAGLKYNSMFDVLNEKEYPLKEVYGLGYAILEMGNYKYTRKSDRNLRQQLDILYGQQYCEYYLRVIRAQQLTMFATVFVLSFVFYGMSQEILAFIIGVVFAGLAFYYYGNQVPTKIRKRSDELLRDFSEVVSKLALLTNAGMIFRDAWQEVAAAGEGTIYTEMRLAVDEMNNGQSEIDAIFNFGARCIIPEIKKFTSTIIQSISKGNSELTFMLQQQSKEVWALKKQLVRREGEKAASKLLIPICVMFVGILIMILVPIFTNLGV